MDNYFRAQVMVQSCNVCVVTADSREEDVLLRLERAFPYRHAYRIYLFVVD